jgi:predicted lysophospholipase L1 biosynthesis ABC-type transport system permease subunit
MMTMRYHHAQRGTLMLVALLIAAILLASIAYLNPSSSGRWLPWTLAIGSVVLAWLFSSLTVEVTEHEVRWHFGPRFWSYRIALAEIESIHIVRNTWWNGFGIRMRPGFRLYNVSGLDAVELRLKTGDVRRIGTDDAQGLAAALRP